MRLDIPRAAAVMLLLLPQLVACQGRGWFKNIFQDNIIDSADELEARISRMRLTNPEELHAIGESYQNLAEAHLVPMQLTNRLTALYSYLNSHDPNLLLSSTRRGEGGSSHIVMPTGSGGSSAISVRHGNPFAGGSSIGSKRYGRSGRTLIADRNARHLVEKYEAILKNYRIDPDTMSVEDFLGILVDSETHDSPPVSADDRLPDSVLHQWNIPPGAYRGQGEAHGMAGAGRSRNREPRRTDKRRGKQPDNYGEGGSWQ